MGVVKEIPPLMVLAEETGNRQIFRFRGKHWALITFMIGIFVLSGATYIQVIGKRELLLLSCLYVFGLLLIYSSLYSLTADQWLQVEGRKKTVKYHKKNLYGKIEWCRSGEQFKEIRVFRDLLDRSRNMNWTIMLVANDGSEFFLGENEFGSFTRENALRIAEKAGHLSGITVVEG